jgi:hypothetical protein
MGRSAVGWRAAGSTAMRTSAVRGLGAGSTIGE